MSYSYEIYDSTSKDTVETIDKVQGLINDVFFLRGKGILSLNSDDK